MLPLVVLDASAALALVLSENQGDEIADLISDIVDRNGQLHVPDLFAYEFGNGLLSAKKRERITVENVSLALKQMAKLPFVYHPRRDHLVARDVLVLCAKHDLSFYAAAYLELALRLSFRLKSFDTHLLELKALYPETII